MIFDTHTHYDDKRFDEDRDALLASLPAEGIGAVMAVVVEKISFLPFNSIDVVTLSLNPFESSLRAASFIEGYRITVIITPIKIEAMQRSIPTIVAL